MDPDRKKIVLAKAKAAGRMLSLYKATAEKGQEKVEDQPGMEETRKNLVSEVLGLQSLKSENQKAMEEEQDPSFKQEVQMSKEMIETVRSLFPTDI